MITFTTVIPTFNSGNTLAETIESILAQRRKSDQIIVVDDGSTDNTPDVVGKYKNIDYIRQDNGGVSAARNRGIEAAAGNWIALCDADDVWHPEKLSILEDCIRHLSQCRLFFHDFYLFGDNIEPDFNGVTERRDTIFPFFRENRITFNKMMEKHYLVNLESQKWQVAPLYFDNVFPWLILGNFLLPTAVVFQRSLFEEYGGFDTSFSSAEDAEFFLRLSARTSFACLDLPLAGYRKDQEGLTGNIMALLGNAERALRKNVENEPELYQRYRKNVELAMARRNGRLGSHYLKLRNRRKALENIFLGLRHVWYEKLLWKVLVASLLPYPVLEALIGTNKRFRAARYESQSRSL